MSLFDSVVGSVFSQESLEKLGSFGLIGALGIEITQFDGEKVYGRMEVGELHLAPNGYLHGGAVVALADTLCGVGCQSLLPSGGTGFTTIELKTNFLSTATSGMINGVARMIHGGRTTQIWDCQITSATTNKILAEFRCTQLVIYPK